jgi:riboflavin kinase / FMN adenylyltransferase
LSVVTLGSFDGFHRGHVRLIERLVEAATRIEAEPAVLLFVHSGHSGITPRDQGARLTRLRRRLEGLRSAGVQLVLLERAPRSPLGDQSIRFIDRRLRELGAARLVLAPEVEMGGVTVAAAEIARRVDARLGRTIDIIDPVEVGGRAVTAAAIRSALSNGDLGLAAEMLGRPYEVSGRVVHGHHRGKSIGIPTANMRLRGFQLPPDGVYAVRARVDDRELLGVANLGYNPTFGDTMRSLETHLLDFEADLYGRWLEVRFVRWLRPERKFSDVPALVEQIRQDIAAAREALAAP